MRTTTAMAVLVVASLALCWSSSELAAQNSELRAKAKALVDEGLEHQGNEEWDEAAAKYRAAYDLVPHPSLLFNLGQVNRLGSDAVTALQFYRKFVAVSSSGELADEARKYITELEMELGKIPFEDPLTATAEKELEGVTDEQPDSADPRVAEGGTDEGADSGRAVGDENEGLQDKDTGDGGGLGTVRVAGLAAVGVGALLVGGGVFFGLRAKSIAADLSESKMEAWTQDEIQKDKDGKAANRNMVILSVAGGAAIVAGAILYIVGGNKSDDSDISAAVGPSANGDGMNFVVSGRF